MENKNRKELARWIEYIKRGKKEKEKEKGEKRRKEEREGGKETIDGRES